MLLFFNAFSKTEIFVLKYDGTPAEIVGVSGITEKRFGKSLHEQFKYLFYTAEATRMDGYKKKHPEDKIYRGKLQRNITAFHLPERGLFIFSNNSPPDPKFFKFQSSPKDEGAKDLVKL